LPFFRCIGTSNHIRADNCDDIVTSLIRILSFLVALVMGAAWVGAAERVAPLCTAVAVGAILVAPVLLGYRRSLRGAGLAVTSVAHCVLAIAGSRAIMAMAPRA